MNHIRSKLVYRNTNEINLNLINYEFQSITQQSRTIFHLKKSVQTVIV